MEEETKISKRFSLTKADGSKILRGFIVASVGSGLTYLAVEIIPGLDTGSYVWLGPILMALTNAARKYLTESHYLRGD